MIIKIPKGGFKVGDVIRLGSGTFSINEPIPAGVSLIGNSGEPNTFTVTKRGRGAQRPPIKGKD